MAFRIKDIDDTQAPLLDHLIELRTRLLRAFAALAVAFAVCFAFADEIFGFLVRPLTEAFPAGEGKLIYTKLYEAFFVEIKVALFAAFFISFPVIANQLWAFVAPGLYAKEKKALLPFLVATPVLFVAGAVLAYLVVAKAFHFLLTVGSDVQITALAGDQYFNFILRLLIVFGVSFELPLLIVALNLIGVLSYARLKSWRRGLILVMFVFAAIVTPGSDPFTMLALALALTVLQEVAIQVARVSDRRKARKSARTEQLADNEASTLPEPTSAPHASAVTPAKAFDDIL